MGRYYTGDDAKFTSREIDFNKELGIKTTSTENPGPINIFMVHWTVYDTTTNIDNGTMPDGKIEIGIKDGNTDLLNNRALTIPDNGGGVAPAENGPLALINNRMRYELLFKPNTRVNQPAIDTIIFDDITLYYYTTPKIISWQYEQ